MKLILITIALAYARASCPGACSGHGSCQEFDKCKCMPRWIGPDCASRECAFGLSWVAAKDKADSRWTTAGGSGRDYTECSSRGTCDRDSGECECFPGYEGSGCSRTTCPNECSGHGRCQYNSEIQILATKLWDSDMTRQCACDRGYEGFDCSSRMCPKGDDPLTDCSDGTEVSKQLVRLSAGTTDDISTEDYPSGKFFTFALTFTDMFNGEYTTRPIVGDWTSTGSLAADIKSALEELPNFAIPSVDVTLTKGDLPASAYCTLTARQSPYTMGGSCASSASNDAFALKTSTTAATCAYVAGVYSDTTSDGALDTVDTADRCVATVNYGGVYNEKRYAKIGSAGSPENYHEFAVLFTDPSNSGKQNLLKVVTGQSDNANMQPRFAPTKSVSQAAAASTAACASQPTCGVSWTVIHGAASADHKANKEHVECSNRGVCDGSTGVCGCFEGYTGEACAVQTVFF